MKRLAIGIVLLGLLVGAGAVLVARLIGARQPIRVGVLHSLTGTMAISEKALVDAVLLAVEEINQDGGVLGRRVEAVVADGKSEPDIFAREAERLITRERVVTVFGCWTSGSRKTVRPVFEKYDHLLFYPVQYEGLEESPNIIYTGAAPNQQIIPAVKWVLGTLGKRIFLVGSDYVFPRAANAIIRDYVRRWRGEIVGEEYILLGSAEVGPAVRAIARARPDAILNTINGDSNVAFFKALRAAGIRPDAIPTMSFSIAEGEMTSLPTEVMAGDYAAWNYFQSVDTTVNERFVKAFKRRYGDPRVTSDPIEAAYVGVHLWAKAVETAGSTDVAAARRAVTDRSFRAPGGMVYVDGENRHLWKTVRIGKIRPDGQFDIVWTSEHPIRPIPFPEARPRQEWEAFLQKLHASWGGRWVNPGPAGR